MIEVKKKDWRVSGNPFISCNVRVEIGINSRTHWKWICDELEWPGCCWVGIAKGNRDGVVEVEAGG